MVSDDNFIRVYGNKNNDNKENNNSNLNKLKKVNSFLSLIFFCFWIVSVITTFKRGYKEYYVYTIIFILIPFLFTVLSNFYILKKLKGENREILRIVGKISVLLVLIVHLINPNALIITKKPLVEKGESLVVSTNESNPQTLLKNYNVLIARVNENDFSGYWRNAYVGENYDNNKIIDSVEILSFNKDNLEITTTVVPTRTQVRYFSRDYVDELSYAFRVGGEEHLKAVIEGNFNVKLDDIILLSNVEAENLVNNYIDNINIAFQEGALRGNVKGEDISIESFYTPSVDDINSIHRLTTEIFTNIYSKNEKDFKNIKKQLLKLTNKTSLEFLDDSYLAYSRLINEQKEIKIVNEKIDMKTIAFSSFLNSEGNNQGISAEQALNNISYLNSYTIVTYSEDILKDNIFIKVILENKQNNNGTTNDNMNNTSNDDDINYEDYTNVDNNNSGSNTNTQNNSNNSGSTNSGNTNNTGNTNNGGTSNPGNTNNGGTNNSGNTGNSGNNNSSGNTNTDAPNTPPGDAPNTQTPPEEPSNEVPDTTTPPEEPATENGEPTTSSDSVSNDIAD